MKTDDFVGRLAEERASAIIRTDDQRAAAQAMEAAIRGGFRIVEFTLTVPGACELIAEFAKKPDVIVGAGTVMHASEARDAVRAGACFLVSPVVDEKVIAEARDLGVASMPGAHTPSELWRAHELGAPLQKLFPAHGTGPAFVRSTLAPMPFLRIVPTNGVDASNVSAYFEAGVFAVGFPAPLFPSDDVREGRWDRIEERARDLLAAVRAAPSSRRL
jgi:2-dehydro-3-deoxyphosphogluconate aldolase/(4S)-4-hydroxy-2-oxoglutarate aldolase